MDKDQLKAWRLDHGLTQKQLAALLPISVESVRAWENDRRPVPAWLEAALVGVEVKMAAMEDRK